MLEEWVSTKDFANDGSSPVPKWHVANDEELQFANELLKLHFESALDDLVRICQSKIHSDSGSQYSSKFTFFPRKCNIKVNVVMEYTFEVI